MKLRKLVGATMTGAGLLLLSCGGSQSGTDATTTTEPPVDASVDLRGVCPKTVAFQTDWNPEAEHGFLYELVGDGYTVDTEKVRVRGNLMSKGRYTGVKVEVRAGGPAIGYGQVTAELYQDPDLMLGFVGTDQAMSNSGEFPTIAVVAPFNINPQIIMWDPATYPDVRSIADLGKQSVKVRYRDGVSFIEYLVASGQLSRDQIEATYDGTAASFIAAGGKDAQQGFGTSEPYYYEKVASDWRRPVAYQYVHEAGWTAYAQSLAGTPETVSANKDCLRKLVPLIQRAQIDFLTSPDRTNALILDLVGRYNNGWAYDAGQAKAAVEKMRSDGLVSDSPDGTLGSFDMDRVGKFITAATPVFTAAGSRLKADLVPTDLVTNEFVDPSISLG